MPTLAALSPMPTPSSSLSAGLSRLFAGTTLALALTKPLLV